MLKPAAEEHHNNSMTFPASAGSLSVENETFSINREVLKQIPYPKNHFT
jgi:hypothetical protein